jgi:serine/threonine protein kinase
METTVEGFCNVLNRCQFFPGERIRELRQRWQQQGGAHAGELDRFTDWLMANHLLTEYQIGVLRRGNGDQLFLGPYRILERIGKGRMAGVYKATHTSGTVVALKVLPPSKAAQQVVLARFQREARLALSVKHANVVRTFHTGEHKGLHYLVMEHLEGETLEEVLARPRRLPVGEAVALVHQAFLGLQAIHEQGLVHRDLKPGNLMLLGGQPHSTLGALVKILDLGTGRALFEEEGGPQFDLTRPGEMLGSSDYMAPEQAKDAHNIDIRADIYGLGCVLYHSLAGQPPFADDSPVRQLLRHATEQPKPIAEHNPAVPAGVQQVLNWMLAKDPAQRYPTPTRAAQALEVYLAANSTPLRQTDASMKDYLEWVETVTYNGEIAPAAAPAAPAPPAKKPPVAARAPDVVPSVAADRLHDITVDVVLDPVPAIPPAPPPPQKKGPPPVPKRTDREDEPPRRRPGRDKEEEEAPRKKKKAEREEEEERVVVALGMTARELTVLIVGLLSVFGMGVLGLLVWLVVKLFG